jgi:hypothetical protein
MAITALSIDLCLRNGCTELVFNDTLTITQPVGITTYSIDYENLLAGPFTIGMSITFNPAVTPGTMTITSVTPSGPTTGTIVGTISGIADTGVAPGTQIANGPSGPPTADIVTMTSIPAVPETVATAILTVIDPQDVTYTIDLGTKGLDLDNITDYVLDLADLGNRTVIEDGYWQFIYTITTTEDNTATANFAGIFTCNSRCCVQQILLQIDVNKFGIEDKINQKAIDRYLKAKTFLDSLVYYANCGNLDKFDNIKYLIDKMCANVECNTCK